MVGAAPPVERRDIDGVFPLASNRFRGVTGVVGNASDDMDLEGVIGDKGGVEPDADDVLDTPGVPRAAERVGTRGLAVEVLIAAAGDMRGRDAPGDGFTGMPERERSNGDGVLFGGVPAAVPTMVLELHWPLVWKVVSNQLSRWRLTCR